MSLDQSMEDISSPAAIVIVSDGLPISTVVNAALNDGMNGGAVVSDGAAQVESSSKRKRGRGRPRKDQSPVRLSSLKQIESSGTVSQKRGRGRPIGSGKFQKMAANFIGDIAMNYFTGKFTPHAMKIQAGEDIVQKLHAFFQGSSRSICVLSGVGPISFVQIKSETSYDGVLNHQGRFELLNMSGSHSFGGSASKNKIIAISVMLGNPDGRVFGGLLAGSLVAADEVNLIVGSFKHGIKCKFPNKMPSGVHVTLAKEEEVVFVAEENGVMVKQPQPVVDCSIIELEAQDPVKEEDPIMKEEDPVKEEDPITKEEEFNSDVVPIIVENETELQNVSEPAEFVTDEMIDDNNNNVDDIATKM